MKPFVGLPLDTDTDTCSYSPDLDRPPCTSRAAVHLAVRNESWGVVALGTCPDHEPLARSCGSVLAEHPFSDLCGFLTGECWS